jgi:hypothetical protein
MDLDQHRRRNWLRELHAVLVICLTLGVIGVVVGIVGAIAGRSWGGTLPVSVPAEHVSGVGAVTGLRGGASLDPHGDISVAVSDATTRQTVVAMLTWLPTALVVVAMLGLLLSVVRSARHHGPFTTVVVRRLRALGVVVIVGGLLAWPAQFLAQWALVDTVTSAGPAATLTFAAPLTWLLVGLGYIAIAEVIGRGRAMQTELDEVI